METKTRNYAFFQNTACEFFPCHKTAHPEDFNCLFCYCPLYMLGKDCGGGYRYKENGIKDCSACMMPHRRENYDKITARFAELVARMAQQEQSQQERSQQTTREENAE